jgi:hypothetical protein
MELFDSGPGVLAEVPDALVPDVTVIDLQFDEARPLTTGQRRGPLLADAVAS